MALWVAWCAALNPCKTKLLEVLAPESPPWKGHNLIQGYGPQQGKTPPNDLAAWKYRGLALLLLCGAAPAPPVELAEVWCNCTVVYLLPLPSLASLPLSQVLYLRALPHKPPACKSLPRGCFLRKLIQTRGLP